MTTKCELCDEDIIPHRMISSKAGYFPHFDNTFCLMCTLETATLQEFRAHWIGTVGQQIHQRQGQWAFNMLDMWRPDLSTQIRGKLIDPFHNDDRLPAFWAFVEENW